MFGFGIFLFVMAVIAAIATLIVKTRVAALVSISLLVAFIVSMVAASYNKVPTKNVGIVTSFGKPTGEVFSTAGVKWTKPWEDVQDWDASQQIFPDDGSSCTNITIVDNRGACIPLKVEWSIKPGTAPEQWASYKETPQGKKVDSDNPRFGTFIYRRVDPGIRAALSSVFAKFNPLPATSEGDSPAPDLNGDYQQTMKSAITKALTNADGSIDVDIKNVVFTGSPTYDGPTTAAIAAYGQKVLQGKNLDVDATNAKKRASVAGQTGIPADEQVCLDIADAQNNDPAGCLWGGKGVVLTKPVS